MKYSDSQIEQIRKLRQTGFSVPEINAQTSVPKSTVLRYIAGVKILPQYYQRWIDRKKSSEYLLKKNLLIAERNAGLILGDVRKRESALIVSMLYWAEGSKKDLSLSNTDPRLIEIFVKQAKFLFKLSDSDFTVSVRIYEDLNRVDSLRFWSKITGIWLDDSTCVNVIKGSKKGKLKYGMCRIRIKKSGIIHKTIFSIINKVFSTSAELSE